MDPKTFAAIGQIAQAIIGVGVPTVKAIIAQFEKEEDPTMEEILALGKNMVEPKDIFKGADGSSD